LANFAILIVAYIWGNPVGLRPFFQLLFSFLRDHITPVLRNLHWLPVRRRVDCKMALLVYKSLHGLTPSCLTTASSAVVCARPTSTPASPQGRTETRLGDRICWSSPFGSLPSDLRRLDTVLGEFRRLLKTYLFGFSLIRSALYRDCFVVRGAPCIN